MTNNDAIKVGDFVTTSAGFSGFVIAVNSGFVDGNGNYSSQKLITISLGSKGVTVKDYDAIKAPVA